MCEITIKAQNQNDSCFGKKSVLFPIDTVKKSVIDIDK